MCCDATLAEPLLRISLSPSCFGRPEDRIAWYPKIIRQTCQPYTGTHTHTHTHIHIYTHTALRGCGVNHKKAKMKRLLCGGGGGSGNRRLMLLASSPSSTSRPAAAAMAATRRVSACPYRPFGCSFLYLDFVLIVGLSVND